MFLPTHRSYADPLVLAEVLRDNDLPRNTVLGGNNMSFWPIGPLGKRAGVVFIRRSSGDDPVYQLALREYIAHLVSKRFNLEWYVEGGRSRTGKLRKPRLGPARTTWRGALDDGRAPDVALVPTSIVYDRLYELDAMAAEQGGSGKSAEGLGWLAQLRRGVRPATTAPPACASASPSPWPRASPRRARGRRAWRRSRSPSATGSTGRRPRPRPRS